MDLSRYLTPNHVSLLAQPVTKTEVLRLLAKKLEEAGVLKDPAQFQRELQDREALMSTGIGLGIGIPHVKSANIERVSLALAVAQTPILDYESLDGLPVQFVVMIAVPGESQREYLEILAKVAFSLKSESRRKSLLAQTDAEKALAVFFDHPR